MKKILLIMAVTWMAFQGCEQNKFEEYSGGDYIQIGFPTSPSDTSKAYTFAYDDDSVTQKEIYFSFQAVGQVRDYDRPITLRQIWVDSAFNAEPGVHYKAFDSEEMQKVYVIKAGTASCDLPIVIFRPQDIFHEYTLRFEVVANDYFQLGDTNYLYYNLRFTSGLQRPEAWDDFTEDYYLGKYSQTKHRWMIEVSGYLWDEETTENILGNSDLFSYWMNKFKRLMAEEKQRREEEGLGPWLDEDGDEITMGYIYNR